jgi:tRNA (guanosine-2'-O-)-methyltransferase
MTPERKKRLTDVLDKRQHDLTVVLENVFDPHNISAVMRTCDAVGIQDIYVLNTKIPMHEKWGRRSSSSAAKWLTVHQFDNTNACFEALRKNYARIFLLMRPIFTSWISPGQWPWFSATNMEG